MIEGDSAEVLKLFQPDSEDLADALVTDPPAGIGFMGQEWDKDKGGRDAWIMWLAGIMSECNRLLKPGAHALVWALPRTSHWTAIALEEAGFEIRDVGVHLFGTGFPKSLDVSKAIDKAAGAERRVVGPQIYGDGHIQNSRETIGYGGSDPEGDRRLRTAPSTDAARQWEGWGTALKPASEHWILARKPFDSTVAENVQRYGTGVLNIGGCRIEADGRPPEVRTAQGPPMGGASSFDLGSGYAIGGTNLGRWPANVTLEEEGAKMLDAQTGLLKSGGGIKTKANRPTKNVDVFGAYTSQRDKVGPNGLMGDFGGASRFFYTAKASRADREYGCENLPKTGAIANHHPTVKPQSLMRWLARLITPPDGLILDPFAGTASTGVAALFEGFRFIGIEGSPEYTPIAEARLRKALRDAETAT